jgi:Zn-dependent M28 family amino/carboxypeptidase
MISKYFLFFSVVLMSCSSESHFNKNMVMVSYSSWLEQELSKDPRFLGRTQRGGREYLLLSSPTLPETEWLAALSHNETKSCGNTIYLSSKSASKINNSTLDSILYEPMINPHQSFDSVEGMMETPNLSRMLQNITELVDLGNRFHNESSGLQASVQVKEEFEAISSDYATSISQIDHTAFQSEVAQKSVVVSIEGSDKADEVIILGAHLDTIYSSRFEPDQSQSPGADDDASGIATLLEIYQAFANANASFSRTVEFHAYAAEEIGLMGSGDLAERYSDQGRKVVAMIQFDMTGYSPDGAQTIYFPTNDTHVNLRRFSMEILKTYLGGDYGTGFIAGGTSDHASWALNKYPALFPFEHPQDYNKNLHTRTDTLDSLNNPQQMVRFAKFGIALVSHLAGLDTALSNFDRQAAILPEKKKDLYLAIEADGIGHSVAVSAASDVASVEVCETFARPSQGCKTIISSMESAGSESDRSFFSVFIEGMSPEKRYRLTGFDSEDNIVASRDIILKAN